MAKPRVYVPIQSISDHVSLFIHSGKNVLGMPPRECMDAGST